MDEQHIQDSWSVKERFEGGSWFLDIVTPHGTVCRLNGFDKQAGADSRLIAAAPDLLEALKDAVEIFEITDACNEPPSDAWVWLYAARAAIAKASGEI